ncbi:MAG: hypothetical protein GSR79_00330 [Desulfurococcales archaeon]|nr:hypothetical protein [Desulfurococcales archaeon]
MPCETIKLTAKFKLKEIPNGLDDLFSTYREIVEFLISYAYKNNITSFKRLKKRLTKAFARNIQNYQATTFTQPARWLLQFTRVIGRGSGREKPRGSHCSRRM